MIDRTAALKGGGIAIPKILLQACGVIAINTDDVDDCITVMGDVPGVEPFSRKGEGRAWAIGQTNNTLEKSGGGFNVRRTNREMIKRDGHD